MTIVSTGNDLDSSTSLFDVTNTINTSTSSVSEARDKLTVHAAHAYKEIQQEAAQKLNEGTAIFSFNHKLYTFLPKSKYTARNRMINQLFSCLDQQSMREIDIRFLRALVSEQTYYSRLFRATEQAHKRHPILEEIDGSNAIKPLGLLATVFELEEFDDTDSIALTVKAITLRSNHDTRLKATELVKKYENDRNPLLQQTASRLSQAFRIGDFCTNIYHGLLDTRTSLFCFNQLLNKINLVGSSKSAVELLIPGFLYMEKDVDEVCKPIESFAKGVWSNEYLYKDPQSPPLLKRFCYLSNWYFTQQQMLYTSLYNKISISSDPTIIAPEKFKQFYLELTQKINKIAAILKPTPKPRTTFDKPIKISYQQPRPRKTKTKKRTQATRRQKKKVPVKVQSSDSLETEKVTTQPHDTVAQIKVEQLQKTPFSLFKLPKTQPFAYHERVLRWQKVKGYDDLHVIKAFVDKGEERYADLDDHQLMGQLQRHSLTFSVDKLLSSKKLRDRYGVMTSTGWALLAELETKSISGEVSRERGMICYGIYQSSSQKEICYHRYFHPISTKSIFDGQAVAIMQQTASDVKYDDDTDDSLISDLKQGFVGEQIRVHDELQYVEVLDDKLEMVVRVFAMN